MRKKLGFLAALALFAAATFIAPHPAQACHNWTDYFDYFSDATMTVPVGWCEFDCDCVTECEGEQTPYYYHSAWSGCL